MKLMSILFTLAFTFNSYSVKAFSEEQVKYFLSAEKVIEISSFTARAIQGSCDDRIDVDRYDRVFVVKQDNKAYLYFTKSELADLRKCREL